MKLNKQNLHHLAPEVRLPAYTLSDTRQGIAHIGVGGFHRAHQAYYTDALMNTGKDLDWAICGVGLRAEDRRARDDLKAQDYLFTLLELGDTDDTEVRVIGAIRDMLLAEDGAQALIDKLASPEIRIVSLTITEGGYCIDDSNGEFMAHLPQIQHDLAHPDAPTTVFGFLCAALVKRRAAGTPAFTLMSCDNLPHNGAVTRKALLAFAALRDAESARLDRQQRQFSQRHGRPHHPDDQHRTSPATGRQARASMMPGRWSANPLRNGCWKTSSSTGVRPGNRSACSLPTTSRHTKT